MRHYRKVFAATAASVAAVAVYYTNERNSRNEKLVGSDKNLEKLLVVGLSQPVIASNEYEDCISKSSEALLRVKEELGLPGVVIGVSVNGRVVWAEGK